MPSLRRCPALLVAAFLTMITACTSQGSSALGSDLARVAQGELQGILAAETIEFHGIPYAAPPIGALRLAPPEPALPWSGRKDASSPGSRCPQPAAPTTFEASLDEDCLTLNVVRPKVGKPSPLPVMVWIHGGGFSTGAGSDYDPATFVATEGVLVVTLNYRLGALGFLGLTENPETANLGLLDQELALRWVRENIGAFGGDTENVTIAGQSAGGDSVCALLSAPAARDLFDRAVMMSGACSAVNVTDVILPGAGTPADTWKSSEVAQAMGSEFATRNGCESSTLECLRGLPIEKFVGSGYWSPVVGTAELPDRPSTALAAGDDDRPVLLGTTRLEGAYFVAALLGAVPWDDADGRAFDTFAALGAVAPQHASVYKRAEVSPRRSWAEIVTDRAYACPSAATATSLSAHRPVYAYEIDMPDSASPFAPLSPDLLGTTTHGGDIPLLFGLAGGPTVENSPRAHDFRGQIGAFVAAGDPNGDGLPTWPEFGDDGRTAIVGRADRPASTEEFTAAHHCDLW
jgi:para-nitrobenzyl esterase